jgi:hypothetical protein
MNDPRAPGAEPYDPSEAAAAMLRWLELAGWDALPHGAIPPTDRAMLETARDRAADAAIVSGRIEALRELRRSIVDWSLAQYRRAALSGIYFSGANEPADQRRDAIEMLIDAATAYLLSDVLPEEVSATLLAPFDVWSGGPNFRSEPEDR